MGGDLADRIPPGERQAPSEVLALLVAEREDGLAGSLPRCQKRLARGAEEVLDGDRLASGLPVDLKAVVAVDDDEVVPAEHHEDRIQVPGALERAGEVVEVVGGEILAANIEGLRLRPDDRERQR